MNRAQVARIADAVLYEGYILYPYRPSVKNRQRWTFGGLYPEAHSRAQAGADACSNQTECLIRGDPATMVEAVVRFLHLTARVVGAVKPPLAEWPAEGAAFRPVDALRIGDNLYHTWQEAEEREVALKSLQIKDVLDIPYHQKFTFLGHAWLEPLPEANGPVTGVLAREQQTLEGEIEATAANVGEGLFRLTFRVLNCTPLDGATSRDDVLLRTLVSTHVLLGVASGEFVSLLEPPEQWRDAAAACRNVGVWPVLAGEPGSTDTMLSSPIILYDYPQVAPESPGNLFDGGEIDEILTLRILTMTDEEKGEMAAVDLRARDLLTRTESLSGEEMSRLHGAMRSSLSPVGITGMESWNPEADRHKLECVHVGPCEVRAGDRVRLRPRGGADIMDLALAGMTATVDSIEQDFEGRVFLAVTVDDDPGRDLGALRQPSHRFFFQPDEVEPLMTARYRLDPGDSRFTVQAFAAGMLSFLGNNPTFVVTGFVGEVEFDAAAPGAGASVRLTVRADSLQLIDKVSASDRRQIEETMWRETLEAAAFPEITFESTEVTVGPRTGDEMPVRIMGRITLHGVARMQQIDGLLTLYSDGVRLAGEFALPQSAYQIRPVVALGGTIKLKNALKVSFDLVAWKEGGKG